MKYFLASKVNFPSSFFLRVTSSPKKRLHCSSPIKTRWLLLLVAHQLRQLRIWEMYQTKGIDHHLLSATPVIPIIEIKTPKMPLDIGNNRHHNSIIYDSRSNEIQNHLGFLNLGLSAFISMSNHWIQCVCWEIIAASINQREIDFSSCVKSEI